MDDKRARRHGGNLRRGVPIATPVFDGAKEADIVDLLKMAGHDASGQVTLYRRAHRRGLRPQGDGRLHLHAEAAPPRRRQDPCPLDRPVLAGHPAAAGRQGAVRRPALRRDGGLGARSLWRGLYAAGDADGEVGRRRRPHQGLRGDRPRRRHVRGRHSRDASTCWSRKCARSASMSSSPGCATPTRRCRRRKPPSETIAGPAPSRRSTPSRSGPPLRVDCFEHFIGAGRGVGPASRKPGDRHEPRGHESLQSGGPAADVRPDQDLDRVARRRSCPGPTARSRSPRPSTTARSSRSATACSARASSGRSRTTSACAASTSA